MIVAIASGKGGTGKTLLATGLARVASDEAGQSVTLLDCDVEAPNSHLFLTPVFDEQEQVSVLIPRVDAERCTGCGRCAEVCAFHALAVVQGRVLVFPALCHGCGSCTAMCPESAITEEPMRLGVVECGQAGNMRFGRGTLDVGQAMATPIIRRLKEKVPAESAREGLVLLDAPPGSACPVVEMLRGSDLALLVTEPTPFGLHDLQIAVEVARDELGVPVAVVVNRGGIGDYGVDDYCRDAGIPIVMRIELDRRIASVYAGGKLWVDELPEYRERVRRLWRETVLRRQVRP